jgi:hypothetical protein
LTKEVDSRDLAAQSCEAGDHTKVYRVAAHRKNQLRCCGYQYSRAKIRDSFHFSGYSQLAFRMLPRDDGVKTSAGRTSGLAATVELVPPVATNTFT